MENNENPNAGGMNSHHMKKYMHGHYWVKILVTIIVLIAVFKLGVCVGEFKAYFGGFEGYGHRGMMYHGVAPYENGMMGNTLYFQKGADGGVPALRVSAPTAPQIAPATTAPATPAQ